jgi:putative transposase
MMLRSVRTAPAMTSSRPRAPQADGSQSVSIFGAVCLAPDVGRALILPHCDTQAMGLFLEKLAWHARRGAQAVLVVGGAGWHGEPDITPLPRPADRPELNRQERVWEFLASTTGLFAATSS